MTVHSHFDYCNSLFFFLNTVFLTYKITKHYCSYSYIHSSRFFALIQSLNFYIDNLYYIVQILKFCCVTYHALSLGVQYSVCALCLLYRLNSLTAFLQPFVVFCCRSCSGFCSSFTLLFSMESSI